MNLRERDAKKKLTAPNQIRMNSDIPMSAVDEVKPSGRSRYLGRDSVVTSIPYQSVTPTCFQQSKFKTTG